MKLLLSTTNQRYNEKENNSYDRFFMGHYRKPRYNTDLDLPKDRVYLTNAWLDDPWIRFLQDSIDEWLRSYNIKYSLSVENWSHGDHEWYIDIPEEYIMLFKLTWF